MVPWLHLFQFNIWSFWHQYLDLERCCNKKNPPNPLTSKKKREKQIHVQKFSWPSLPWRDREICNKTSCKCRFFPRTINYQAWLATGFSPINSVYWGYNLGLPPTQDAGSSPPGWWTIFRIGNPELNRLICDWHPGWGVDPSYNPFTSHLLTFWDILVDHFDE